MMPPPCLPSSYRNYQQFRMDEDKFKSNYSVVGSIATIRSPQIDGLLTVFVSVLLLEGVSSYTECLIYNRYESS